MADLLVTGSDGVIGSALSCGMRFAGDVRDPDDVRRAVASCRGVIHLAAVSRVTWAESDPELCRGVNVDGTRRVVEAALAAPHRPWVLLASSREAYASDNVYGRSKAEAERIVEEARGRGLRAAIVRIANVYGSVEDHADRVALAFARAAVTGGRLRVDGESVELDLIHIDDVVRGLRLLTERLDAGESPPTADLATGQSISLGALARLVLELAGTRATVEVGPPRGASFRGARALAGWTPRVALRDGLSRLTHEARRAFTYETFAREGVRWQATPRFRAQVEDGPFADLAAALERGQVLWDGSLKRLLEVDGWLVKVHKPGRAWRRATALVRGTRARRELKACQAVLRGGVPTVPLDAIAEWAGGSASFVRKRAGWTSLDDALHANAGLLRRYGEFGRAMHDAGIAQHDFNPSNVLYNGEMRLIDFERVRVRTSPLGEAERLRLVAKLVRWRTVGRAGLQAFLDGYVRPGESRDDVRERVLAYAQRQAAIDRSRLARACVEENRNFGKLTMERYIVHFRKARGRGPGLAREEAAALETLQRVARRAVGDAIEAWKQANLESLSGGPVPLAAMRERRGRTGFVVY